MAKISYNQATYGSIFKLVKYLGYLTKVRMIVEVEGVKQEYLPPERVIISNKFFRSFKCKSCGKCCIKPKFSLVYTVSDYARVNAESLKTELEWRNRDRLINEMVEVPVEIRLFTSFDILNVEHTSVQLFSNQGHQCSFLFEQDGRQLCGVHKIHPNHCSLPHIQIDQTNGKRTRLLKRQYGRNWALGCEAKEEPFDYDEFLYWDLPCMRKLMFNAEDLQMETWLPEVVTYLEKNRDQFRRKIPANPIVIYDEKLGIPERYLVKD
jgi:Fe-S-cluster containining protein